MYMKKKLNLAALLLAAALLGACGGQKQDAADTVAQTESAETENAEQKSSIDLADGVYTVDFKTDSSMFKVNESKNGKGVLTVKDGEATLHISLTSKPTYVLIIFLNIIYFLVYSLFGRGYNPCFLNSLIA